MNYFQSCDLVYRVAIIYILTFIYFLSDSNAREALTKIMKCKKWFFHRCQSHGGADAVFYTEGKLLSGGSAEQLQEQRGYFKGDYSTAIRRMIIGYSSKIALN